LQRVGQSPDGLAAAFGRGSLIKVCGLREPEHAAAAARYGADLLGFIFAPARRQVTVETAKACVVAAREAAGARAVIAVGVFVDAQAREIERIAREADLDAAQLHGSEDATFVQDLGIPATKVLRPKPGARAAELIAELDTFRASSRPPSAFLIDAYAEGAMGGTGDRADWDLAAEISVNRPLMLAGGLDPENVSAAIRRVRPAGVDVSSGVETGGVKDVARIEAFIRAARQVFQQ
jgi:phosphoribosylanthranilate isomerase